MKVVIGAVLLVVCCELAASTPCIIGRKAGLVSAGRSAVRGKVGTAAAVGGALRVKGHYAKVGIVKAKGQYLKNKFAGKRGKAYYAEGKRQRPSYSAPSQPKAVNIVQKQQINLNKKNLNRYGGRAGASKQFSRQSGCQKGQVTASHVAKQQAYQRQQASAQSAYQQQQQQASAQSVYQEQQQASAQSVYQEQQQASAQSAYEEQQAQRRQSSYSNAAAVQAQSGAQAGYGAAEGLAVSQGEVYGAAAQKAYSASSSKQSSYSAASQKSASESASSYSSAAANLAQSADLGYSSNCATNLC